MFYGTIDYLIVAEFFLFVAFLTVTYLAPKNAIVVKNLLSPCNRKINILFVIFIILKLCSLVTIIYIVGVNDWFSGSYLAQKIEVYNDADSSLRMLDVVTLILNAPLVAVAALKIESLIVHSNNKGANDNQNHIYFIYTLVFLVLPMISMSRSALFLGLLVGFYLFYVLLRKSKLVLAIFVLVLPIVVLIGMIRSEEIGENADAYAIIKSELSPSIALVDIHGENGLPDLIPGYHILVPYLMNVAPKTILVSKPLNSTALGNMFLYPEAYEKGFITPLGFFGVMYLNFGVIGAAIIGIICGLATRKLQALQNYRYRLGIPIICAYYVYSIMRDDPSVSLFQLSISLISYKIFEVYCEKQASIRLG